MRLKSSRKTASTDVWKRAVTTCGKTHTLLSSLQWQDGKPSTAFWKRALTTCGKPHPLLSETAVTTYGNPSTAYWMCFDSTRKTASTDAWKRTVTTCGKPHTLLSAQQWKHMEHLPLFIKCAVKTHRKPNPLFWERVATTCGKPHPLLSETAVTTYGNPSTAY